MRELSVTIRFISPSLGSEKQPKGGKFQFMRSPVDGPTDTSEKGKILFLASWHQANMKFASQMLGRHQKEIQDILWDVEIDCQLRRECWYRCYYRKTSKGRDRWSTHESIVKGQTVTINCVVPSTIDDTDFWSLMQLSGKYKGLSPFRPGKHGHFEVVSIRNRRPRHDPYEANRENPSPLPNCNKNAT